MEQEEKKTDAPVKPTRTRAPRKSASKAPAEAPSGDVGENAASVPAPAKTSKPRAPRRKKEAPAEKPTPAVADAPAPAPAAEKPAEPAPAAPAPTAPQEKPAQRPQRKVRDVRNKQEKQETPAPKPEPPQPERTESNDIPEPPSEFSRAEPVPGFATPEIVGGNEGGGNSRRKRRRNRNRNRDEAGRDPQQNQPSPVDPEELNRRAWKIFLGEVTEEGLALMDDRTAAEASRRAFKVAEIFLLEAARHRPSRPVAPAAPEVSEPAPEATTEAE